MTGRETEKFNCILGKGTFVREYQKTNKRVEPLAPPAIMYTPFMRCSPKNCINAEMVVYIFLASF